MSRQFMKHRWALLLAAGVALVGAAVAVAPEYTLPAHSNAAGGQIQGGQYRADVTIGESAAGKISGGQFSAEIGFMATTPRIAAPRAGIIQAILGNNPPTVNHDANEDGEVDTGDVVR